MATVLAIHGQEEIGCIQTAEPCGEPADFPPRQEAAEVGLANEVGFCLLTEIGPVVAGTRPGLAAAARGRFLSNRGEYHA